MSLIKKSENCVFISYTRNDLLLSKLAKKLANSLSQKGIKTWLDKNNISPGKNWNEAIQEALRNSNSIIALLNPNSYSSSWVREELKYALFDEKFKNRLLPVFIGEFPIEEFNRLPWVLTHISYLKLDPRMSIEENSEYIVNYYLKMVKNRG